MYKKDKQFNTAVFTELQQHLQDLSESFQIHCCWKAGASLSVEFRLNDYVAKHSCSFCAKYKEIPGQEKICIDHDYCNQTALLAEHQEAVEARCPAGAMELIVPFYRNGICLGAVLCGPYRKVEDRANDLLTELSDGRIKSLINVISTLLKNVIGSAYADRIQEPTDQRLKKAVEFIRKNFRKNITALDAATQANLSRSRFLHLFPQECGRTFGAYLRELRIAESCKLLQNKALTIDEIALNVGFCSQSHFTSVFRSKMKVTPNYYRRISTK
ncbi:MAG: helix-turn-helix domain-containing protein [Lentisphaeria bacterium]|nr:helix-turn-helix domain-containing protein [Lentisphaeria bacterium]